MPAFVVLQAVPVVEVRSDAAEGNRAFHVNRVRMKRRSLALGAQTSYAALF